MDSKKPGIAIAVLVGGVCAYLFLNHQQSVRLKYSSGETDIFTFTRNVSENNGALDPNTVVSAGKSVRLEDVFSKENIRRYGADTIAPDGVGLKVSFVWTSNDESIARTEFFEIPARSGKNRSNPERRELVARKKEEFQKLAAVFLQPVKLTQPVILMVDTTNGGGNIPPSVRRVTQGMVSLQEEKGYSVPFQIRIIHGGPYQGNYFEANSASAKNVEIGMAFVQKSREEDTSFVFAAIAALCKHTTPGTVAHLFTDGMENTPRVSLYRSPELLHPENWNKLDAFFPLDMCGFYGITIKLYPMELEERQAVLQKKALAYIADRLRKSGAAVDIGL